MPTRLARKMSRTEGAHESLDDDPAHSRKGSLSEAGADLELPLDESWAAPRQKASLRLRASTGVLSALLVATLGFTAGAKVGKDRAGSGGAAGVRANALRGVFGAGGVGGGRFPGAARASGTGAVDAAGSDGGTGVGGAAGSPAAGTEATATTLASDPLGGLLSGIGTDTGSSEGDASGSGETPLADPTIGTVTKLDGTTMTVTNADGTSITVSTNDSTNVRRSLAAALADLTLGEEVTITGEVGVDGVITAREITVGASSTGDRPLTQSSAAR